MATTVASAEDTERRIADARAEGYADGYTQARQRAESRVALGLPLTPRDDEG